MKKTLKIIFYVILSLSLLILISNILFPSYLSVHSACYQESFNNLYGGIFYTSGYLNVDELDNETIIEVYVEDELDYRTLKHELVHLNQYYENRLYGCNNLIRKYFNEVEAYSMSYLPNSIFYKIYPKNIYN